MTDTEDDLKVALAEPDTVTIAGKPVRIKQLTLKQLPLARECATQLFSDEKVNFEQDDFILALEDEHIALMIQLMVLMTDMPLEQLSSLLLADAIALFSKTLEVNADFFLLIMTRAMQARLTLTDLAGLPSFSA